MYVHDCIAAGLLLLGADCIHKIVARVSVFLSHGVRLLRLYVEEKLRPPPWKFTYLFTCIDVKNINLQI